MISLSPDLSLDMDITVANAFVDGHNSATYVMDPSITMHLLWLLAYDNIRLKGLSEIIQNTIMYCRIILLPDDANPFPEDMRALAREVIEKHREILAWLNIVLDQ